MDLMFVCISQNSYIEILSPQMMVLGSKGRYEVKALINVMNALIKGVPSRAWQHMPVISALSGAEAGGSQVQAQPG